MSGVQRLDDLPTVMHQLVLLIFYESRFRHVSIEEIKERSDNLIREFGGVVQAVEGLRKYLGLDLQ